MLASILAAALGVVGVSQDDPLKDCAPNTLDAAFVCLDAHWTAREEFKALAYDDIGGGHFGVGMWMRNNWGLWGGGPLGRHFNELGITHPDDMSGIVLTSYWLRLHACPLRLDEQVGFYRGYWNLPEDADVNDYLDRRPNLDCTSQHRETAQ